MHRRARAHQRVLRWQLRCRDETFLRSGTPDVSSSRRQSSRATPASMHHRDSHLFFRGRRRRRGSTSQPCDQRCIDARARSVEETVHAARRADARRNCASLRFTVTQRGQIDDRQAIVDHVIDAARGFGRLCYLQLRSRQRVLEIRAQIGEILDTHRQAHQRIADTEARALIGGNRRVRHDPRVSIRLATPPSSRERETPQCSRNLFAGQIGLELDRHHAANNRHLRHHLAFRQRVLRMRGRPG